MNATSLRLLVPLGALVAASLCEALAQEARDTPPGAAHAIPDGHHAIDLTDDRIDAMRQTLAAVGRALRQGDPQALAEQFDCYRMTVECRQRGGEKLIPTSQMAAFAEGIEQGLTQNLAASARFVAFDEFEILRCVMSDDNTTAIVLVREVSNELDVINTFRWWLVQGADGWKIYDFEDQHVPIRCTDGMLAGLEARAQGGLPKLLAIQSFNEEFLTARNAMADGDPYQAEAILARLDLTDVPPPLEAVVWSVRAAVACDREAYPDAMRFIERANKIRPDMPVADLVRATAFIGLRRYADAQRHAQAYLDHIGEDPTAFSLLGEAKRGLGLASEAAECFRRALQEHRNSVDALAQLVRVEPELEAAQILAHLGEMDDTDEKFDTMCYFLMEEEDFAALDRVVAAYKTIAPLNTDVAYYGATVLQHEGKHEEAAAMILPAISRVAEDEIDAFVYVYVDAMVQAGKPLEAYERLPNKSVAFEWLAESLLVDDEVDDQDAATFEKLHAMHEAALPDDLLLPYFRARRLVAQEKPDEAAALLAPLLGKIEDPEYAQSSIDWYLSAMLAAKKPVEAYDRVEDKADAFETLASSLAYSDEDSDEARQLQDLVAAHQKEHADDPNLAYYGASALLHREKPLEAAELILPAVKRLADEKHEELPYYVSLYLEAMLAAGQPLEGYQQAPDAVEAFRTLAGLMVDEEGPTDQLEPLARLHMEKHPDDPWGAYYLAEAAVLLQQWQEAASRLVAARENTSDPEIMELIDYSLTNALYELGQFERAFELMDPDADVFIRLAQWGDGTESLTQLERILDLYRAGAADDPALAYFTARLHWHRGEHAAAVELLQSHREAIETSTEYGWQLDDTLVRSLITLGRFEEAIAAARVDHSDELPSSILLATAHAAAGDVFATRQALEAYFKDRPWYRGNWLYRDEILGPALRSDAFAELRRELDAAREQVEGAPPSP